MSVACAPFQTTNRPSLLTGTIANADTVRPGLLSTGTAGLGANAFANRAVLPAGDRAVKVTATARAPEAGSPALPGTHDGPGGAGGHLLLGHADAGERRSQALRFGERMEVAAGWRCRLGGSVRDNEGRCRCRHRREGSNKAHFAPSSATATKTRRNLSMSCLPLTSV